MAVIKWQDCYTTGIAAFDRDHQKLVELINTVYAAIRSGQAEERIEALLDPFFEYAGHHFSREEEVMKNHSFPGYDAHRDEHLAFTKKISAMRQSLADGQRTEGMALELLNLLRHWLLNHIMLTDKEYAPFLQGLQWDGE